MSTTTTAGDGDTTTTEQSTTGFVGGARHGVAQGIDIGARGSTLGVEDVKRHRRRRPRRETLVDLATLEEGKRILAQAT